MTITEQQLLDLEADINDILAEDCARIHFTFHAAFERINDPRNKPSITLHELDNVFQTFIQTHLSTIIDYDEGTRFVLKCNKTHLHFPCAITYDRQVGKLWVVQNVITVMRKKDFKSPDNFLVIN